MPILDIRSDLAAILSEEQDVTLNDPVVGDIKVSYRSLASWSDHELAEEGFARADDPPEPPAGYRSIGIHAQLVGNSWLLVRDISPIELDTVRGPKLAELSAEFARRAALPISFSVASAGAKTWDADAEAIVNIMGIVQLIQVGADIPDPRDWTAHGEVIPTSVTHAELINIGAAIAGRKDDLFVTKKTKEAEILALTDAVAIQAYDVSAGW